MSSTFLLDFLLEVSNILDLHYSPMHLGYISRYMKRSANSTSLCIRALSFLLKFFKNCFPYLIFLLISIAHQCGYCYSFRAVMIKIFIIIHAVLTLILLILILILFFMAVLVDATEPKTDYTDLADGKAVNNIMINPSYQNIFNKLKLVRKFHEDFIE